MHVNNSITDERDEVHNEDIKHNELIMSSKSRGESVGKPKPNKRISRSANIERARDREVHVLGSSNRWTSPKDISP